MKRVVLLWLAILSALADAYAGNITGFQLIVVPRSQAGRALKVAVWYPAKSGGAAKSIGETGVFFGIAGFKDAIPKPGRHPLVVMSHGWPGNWSNEDWLADALTKRGYIVAAPNHPGTTTDDVRPISLDNGLWERPRDLSHIISVLTSDPPWSPLIDPQRIAAIGHSMGGWTVMELAGARFDGARFEADCKEHQSSASCEVTRNMGLFDASNREANMPLAQDLKDERIKAFITLDLGLARAFDPASLVRIDRPVLVIATGSSAPFATKIQTELNSKYMADHLPPATTRYLQIMDAAHFSFLPICKPNARTILGNDAVLCDDGGGRDRETIHRQVSSEVIDFLADSLKFR